MSVGRWTMRAMLVGKKEFLVAIRSRVLLGLIALFVLFTVGGIVLAAQFGNLVNADSNTVSILFGLLSPAAMFVPIIGTLIGYKAIAAERESGSIYSLLGMSHSRGTIVFGKIIGRSCVVAVSIVLGFSAGAVALVAATGTIRPVQFLVFVGATLLLGVAYVSLAVAISSTTGSTTRAAWGAFGTFVVLNFLWELLAFLLHFLHTGTTSIEPPLPEWFVLFFRLSPAVAYQIVATATLPEDDLFLSGLAEVSGTAGETPFYLEPWFAVGILGFWIVVPAAAGYVRFKRLEI
ncbi:ABC transporter permease subunit [Halostagnicola sp. A-GB9-2]|uniref:ABC transporter permease subunit n=1 Tax=Halostagnicola sp. A-GB9-2 TaxID=3048066 RepID=UPI0024BFDC60|nr:ABC transporter permease subunit [Halostagnicola sp. A-GB9-2]MDJ1431728.1 ABC transporter permease subunit [Halostagnicola sp. A-GB9-2]